MTPFDRAFTITVGVEMGLSMAREDRGNWTGGAVDKGVLKGTKFGISAARYPDEDIQNLSLERARELYMRDYWTPNRCELLPWPWSAYLFDMAVNPGPGRPIAMDLQDALGVTVDGRIGPRTVDAARRANNRHEARLLVLRNKRFQRAMTADVHGDGWLARLFILALEVNQEVPR